MTLPVPAPITSISDFRELLKSVMPDLIPKAGNARAQLIATKSGNLLSSKLGAELTPPPRKLCVELELLLDGVIVADGFGY